MKKDIVSVFKKRVLKILASPEVKFILFGSRCRGDADEFSDYDLLIITSEQEHDVKERIEEIEMDIFVRDNAIINSHLFSEKELKRLYFEPFIMNALEEGIAA
jgi:predicted nucleotidyltransferase